MDFRSAKVAILDSSEDVLRGVYGLSELLTPPSFEIPARVGKRYEQPISSTSMDLDPSSSTPTLKKLRLSHYIVGQELDDAEKAGEQLDIIWPFKGANGWTDWRAIEAIWKHALEAMGPYRRKVNDAPLLFTHPPTLSPDQTQLLTQMAFERLNLPAIALISRPLASLYAVGSTTGICIDIGESSTMITPVVDTVVSTHPVVSVPLGVQHCVRYMAKLLEKDQKIIAALSAPPVQSLPAEPTPAIPSAPSDPAAAGASPIDPSSAPIDAPPTTPSSLNAAETTVDSSSSAPPAAAAAPLPPRIPVIYPQTPINETLIRFSRQLFNLGLIRPLLLNGQRLTVEQEEEGVTDIAAALVAASRVASTKSHKSAAKQAEDAKRKAKADITAAGMDVMLVEFEGREISVGAVRHKFCEPLFDPRLMKGLDMDGEAIDADLSGTLALQEAVELSIGSLLNAQERLGVWDGVVVVGEAAKIKTLPSSILSHLMPYILTDPESTNDSQPKNTRYLKIPKYFPEYVEEGGWTIPFLGASIAGRTIYHDASGRFFTTKFDYNSQGPAGVKSIE